MAPTRKIINMMKEMENNIKTHSRNNRRSTEETGNKI